MSVIDETLLGLSDAAKAVPKIDGKRPHASTIWRWCRIGINGVSLEYARLGRRIVTSKEALMRFSERLAAADQRPDPRTLKLQKTRAKSTQERQRARAITRAEKRLEDDGI